jgi:hypothetical protein
MPAAHETGRLGVRPDKLTKTEELKRSRAKSKTAAGKSVTAAICALWLLVASAEDQALGGESDARSQAIIATEDHAQEWDRAEALARALTSSLQGELDAVRSLAAAERIKQKQLLEQEQRRADNLAQDLASLRAELESTGIADLDLVRAAVAETKQKQIFEQDRKRVEDLTRELASTKDELESGKRQIAALKAFHALRPSESTVCNSQDRTAEPGTRETAPELAPKATVETSQSTPTNAAHPITDAEQKLLARANTLLVRAEVRDARRLLRYAVRHGSAQAAFMLAETYDPRVPRSQLSCGSSGDRTKARELYERAWAGGVEDAKERIEALK